MPFDFTVCVESYLDQVVAEGQYTRELSWINLWNGVRPHIAHNTRHLLILDGEALERTAYLIGFYLASWGMFRGMLLSRNIEFFKNLSVFMFNEIQDDFWTTTFSQLNQQAAAQPVDRTIDTLRNFFHQHLPDQNDCDLIIGKLLLGVWGQCPARDKSFEDGLSKYKQDRNILRLPRNAGRLSSAFLVWLNQQAENQHWNLNLAGINGLPYPPGKLIDMALFQYGIEH